MAAEDGVKLLQAMGKYSNYSDQTLWLEDSYPVQVGMVEGMR